MLTESVVSGSNLFVFVVSQALECAALNNFFSGQMDDEQTTFD